MVAGEHETLWKATGCGKRWEKSSIRESTSTPQTLLSLHLIYSLFLAVLFFLLIQS